MTDRFRRLTIAVTYLPREDGIGTKPEYIFDCIRDSLNPIDGVVKVEWTADEPAIIAALKDDRD